MQDIEASPRKALHDKLKLYKELGDTVGFHISHEDYDLILDVLEPPPEAKGQRRSAIVFDRITRCLDGENGATCMTVLIGAVVSVMKQAISTRAQLDEACTLIEKNIREQFGPTKDDDDVAQGGVQR